MARSDNTQFLVEVLEGPAAGATVPLVGREMPYRAGMGGSISYGRTMRSKLTWYPGNRVASQQIIGPVLKPTTINGVWKERYLGTDRPIELVELFEELLEMGVQVLVFWQTIERRGIVKDVTWKPGVPTGGLSDIEWEITFEWNAQTAQIPRTVGTSDISLRDGLVRAASGIGSLINTLDNFSFGAGSFIGLSSNIFQVTKRAVENVIETFTQPFVTLSNTASRTADEPALPARTVEDASAAAGRAQETAGRTAEIISDVFPGVVIVQDNVEDVLNEALDRYEISEEAFLVAREQFDQRTRLEEIIRPDEFVTVVPLIGGDLRELAIRYYGDADLWDRIAKQNGLDQSEIPEGVDEIVIPLSLPDATDQKLGC